MNYLAKGLVSTERFNLLMQLTKVTSEPVKQALSDHLVKGMNKIDAAVYNEILQQNFNRAFQRLNDIAGIVENIKELDWLKLNASK
jgi:hypothetical protein